MPGIADVKQLPETEVTEAFELEDGTSVFAISGPAIQNTYVREDDPDTIQALLDSHDERVESPTPEQVAAEKKVTDNQTVLHQKVSDALSDLQQIIDAQNPTPAQIATAVKTMARIQKYTIRLLVGAFDATN